jgi:hypothetical protein
MSDFKRLIEALNAELEEPYRFTLDKIISSANFDTKVLGYADSVLDDWANIPPNLKLGTKRTIRKLFGTPEEIVIGVMEDEYICEASRKTVTLTSIGDFWTLVKVTDTRWDIEAGRQRGEGFIREANGTMTCTGESSTLTTADTPTDSIYTVDKAFVFPKAFKTIPVVVPVGKGITEYGFATLKDDVTVSGFTARGGSFNDLVELKIAYTATGKWYEEV